MFACFEGTPGSGKSYDAIKKILDNLKKRRVVYTNIDGVFEPDQLEFTKYYTGLDDWEISKYFLPLDNSSVHTFYKSGQRGYLAVIDEAHKPFNSRDFQKEKNRLFADWSSTHRHEGVDCILITQDAQKIDSQIRSNFEWTYRYRKMNFFGGLTDNFYLVYTFTGEGDGRPIGPPTKKRYDSRIFNCYKSYVADDLKEVGFMKKVNILKHPIFFALPVILLLFLYLASKSSFAKGKFVPDRKVVSASTSTITSPVPVPVFVQPQKSVKKVSSGKKLAVSIKKDNSGVYVVMGFFDGDGQGQYVIRPVDDLENLDVPACYIHELNLDTICKCKARSHNFVGQRFEIPKEMIVY